MKTNYKILFSILFLLSLLFAGCRQAPSQENERSNHPATMEAEHHDHGVIHLTRDQIQTMDITFGDFTQVKVNDFVSATGTLGLPPNALTSLSAKASGFIQNSNKYVEGSYVKKGSTMAYLENPEFIDYQREYLEVAAELTFLEQELARQETLVAAEAGVDRHLQQLQSQVGQKTAGKQGLANQLRYLGINVETLDADNMVQRIPIIAPTSGYITAINIHNGMYVTPEMELVEIIDADHLHLELDVFEKDFVNIKEEQRISYTVPALGPTIYEGEVYIIGRAFDTANKTVRIHGHLMEERPQFITDLFVEAKIWLTDQTVAALPESAIIKDGASTYIYITDGQVKESEYEFQQRMVIPGTSDNGFTAVQVIDPIPEGMQVVTKGAYYVYAQSQVGELDHDH
jgi:cobalt-zinc-cadmium efflux system membrane fusion protein